MRKKSITLLELVLALVLFSMVVLAVSSLDVASLGFFKSSNNKVEVLNEVSLLMEHIQKGALQAHGWINDVGFGTMDGGNTIWFRIDDPVTPSDFTDDTFYVYRFNPGANTVEQCVVNSLAALPGLGGCPVLSHRIESCVFSSNLNTATVRAEVVGVYNASGPANDEQQNPHVEMKSDFFLGSHSFR